MSKCKHRGGRLSGTGLDGVDRVVCNDCGATLEEADPRVRAAVEALYANQPERLGAANTIGSLELAKLGRKGAR